MNLLEKRIEICLKIQEAEEKGKKLLLSDDFDAFFELQPLVEDLLRQEKELSEKMLSYTNFDHETLDLEKNKERILLLEEILNKIFILIEDNRTQLQKMFNSVAKTQKENSATGNPLLRYYPRYKVIPKFVDLES